MRVRYGMAESASVDIEPLLELWSLEERELGGILPVTSFSTQKRGQMRRAQIEGDETCQNSPLALPLAVAEPDVATNSGEGCTILPAQKTSSIICSTCGYCINEGLHWCAECGTAILTEISCTYSASPVIDVDMISSRVVQPGTTISPVKVLESCSQLPSQLCTTESAIAKKSSHIGNYTHSAIRKKSPSKPSVGGYRLSNGSVRHWHTSGVYMWRKPSSLKLMKVSPNAQIAEPEDHPRPDSSTPVIKQARVRNNISCHYLF